MAKTDSDQFLNTARGPDKTMARMNYTFPERNTQTREIVYFLQQPETHSFRLYHDYTETRDGIDKYLNVVRSGSKASDPEALDLDLGKELRVETLKGQEITDKGIKLSELSDSTEVIVIWFDAVVPPQTKRIRITETYTDPNRYLLNQNQLIWDRSFGRPRNTVVLPAGWYLTDNAVPAIINQMKDGRISLYYENDRPGNIDVYVKALKR